MSMQLTDRARFAGSLFITLALLPAILACGVKGPPLPPVSTTPEQADRRDGTAGPRATSTPRPTPTPTPTSTRRARGR